MLSGQQPCSKSIERAAANNREPATTRVKVFAVRSFFPSRFPVYPIANPGVTDCEVNDG